ncbi:MAG: hypothetical protein WC655_15210 [Candidatus Hydrogenedentales bacterium]|jgi:Spy/CpxP family protein refolding chaperone
MTGETNETTSAVAPAVAPVIAPTQSAWRKYLHWPTLLLAAVVLVSGIVIGSAGTATVIRRGIADAVQHPEQSAARATKRLRRQLDLSEQQAQQVEKILSERTKAFGDIYRDNLPRIAQEIATTKEQVGAVLTDEQRLKWLDRVAKLERLTRANSTQTP